MGNSQSGYHYDSLGENEIRLLRMRNSWIPGELKLDLEHFDLSSAPDYIALSYTWGSPRDTYGIKVNDEPVEIRSNLWSFLQHARPDCDAPGTVFPAPSALISLERELRYSDPAHDSLGYFWVDALCINQDDLEERNSQVPRMKDIYEKAAKVIVWLGYEDNDSKLAMNTIEELGEAVRKSGGLDIDFSKYRMSITPRIARALRSLAQREWWDRAWVVQEVSTPYRQGNPTSVWCGHQRVPWHCFLLADLAFHQMFAESDLVKYLLIHNPKVAFMNELKGRRQNSEDSATLPIELLTLLSDLRSSDATDHKDKVYAILALTPEAHHRDLQPDYSKAVSVGEVYRQVARYIINRDHNLDVLGHCFMREYDGSSWAPDWSVPVAPTPFPKIRLSPDGMPSSVYRASADRIAAMQFSGGGATLTVRGIEVDQILGVSEPNFEEGGEVEDADQRPLLLSWSRFLFPDAKDVKYISGGTLKDAAAHVLCADVSDTWYKAVKRGTEASQLATDMLTGRNLPRLLASHDDHANTVHKVTRLRRLVRTKKGYLGLASMIAEPGDKVCVVFGSQVPLVLRPAHDGWSFVSEAYVHGCMDGEVLRGATQIVKDFILV